MSKPRSKSRRATKVPQAAAPDLTPNAAWGAYEGALPSIDRGWVYIPDLRSSPELDHLSREVLYQRISHLYRNEGLPRRIINGITRLVVGTGLMPEPMTKDERYNDKVRSLWAQRAESPRTFSLSEKFSCAGAQRILKKSQLKLGDAGMVAARDEDNRLRFALYGGHQIGSGDNPPKGMKDGVLVNRYDAAEAYRLLGRDADGKPTQVDVPARDMLFLVRRDGVDWHRGATCLAHAVNKLQDRSEVDKALNKGIKMSSYLAWAIEQQANAPRGPGGLGPGSRPQKIIEDPKSGKPVTLEKFLGSGQIEELQPGQSLKILHDQRPHPNVQAYREDQIRDIVNGTDWPFEVLWKIEALGGANTRFILVDAQAKCEEEQEELVEQVLAPAYIMLLQDWEAHGDLEPCTDPEWWNHEWVLPPRLSVDFGRDGRIYIEQWVKGHITLKTIFGAQSLRWKRETTQWLEEIAWKKREMERLQLTTADLPASAGTSVIAPAEAGDDKQGKGGGRREPPQETDDDVDDE
jgi:capsid protein